VSKLAVQCNAEAYQDLTSNIPKQLLQLGSLLFLRQELCNLVPKCDFCLPQQLAED